MISEEEKKLLDPNGKANEQLRMIAYPLESVIRECWQIAEDHGFHFVGRTFGDACALIHSEVTEAFESFREKGHYTAWIEVDGKPEGTLAELADIVIRVFDTAVTIGSPETFAEVIKHKMEYNKTRPYMHNKAM